MTRLILPIIMCLPLLMGAGRPNYYQTPRTPARVYYGQYGRVYLTTPIQTPKWHPGFNQRMRTQVIPTIDGGQIIINSYYSR